MIKEQMEQIYKNIPPEKIPWNIETPPEILQKLMSSKKITPCKAIELGCGTGIFSIILAKRGAQFIESCDVSNKSIEIANKRARINGVSERVNFQTISIYEMDYKENYFDFIVGLNILHHIKIESLTDKIYTYLRPGGIAYFSEPFGNVQWLERLRLLIPIQVKEDDKSHWQEKLTYKDVEKHQVS